MNRRVATPWSRFALLAAATWLAHGVLGSVEARASCGDYVTVVGPDGRVLHGHDVTPTPGGGVSERRQGSSPLPCSRCSGAPHQLPCHDPWCSGTHVPMTPPVAAVPPGIDLFITGPAERPADSPAQRLDAVDTRTTRIERADTIFHPPRSA
jgi:hypothetical protein